MYSKKDSLDKFYTKEEVAKLCISSIALDDYDIIIEPSAGNGAFSNNIPNVTAYDIAPEDKTITKQDWLEYNHTETGRTLVIGNPPFGLRNKLSQSFIKKAMEFADTIAFILPDVYLKHTLQSIFTEEWRLKEVVELDRDSFLLNGKPYHVPCKFFIFDKSEGANLMFDVVKYATCKDFDFCVKSNRDEADIFILGASPKTVKFLDEVKPSNRGYYLKAKGLTKWELVKKIQATNWIGNSSANGGVSWLTKPEIVKCYMESNYDL